MQTNTFTAKRTRLASSAAVAVLAVSLVATGLGKDAAASSTAKDFQQAAGVIVGSDEQMALSVTNPSAGSLSFVLTVTGGSGEPILQEERTLKAGATVMPDLLSGEELAGEDSTEWPIYGRPINVSVTTDGSGDLAPILSVATLSLDGGDARAWPIYGRADLKAAD